MPFFKEKLAVFILGKGNTQTMALLAVEIQNDKVAVV